ncbi:hypothetical protein [Pseudoxanthomonas winnipegensis]|uniref:Uncharacterized protein n=1 Tax=Pseudoxanthomonas winnipegensis TaxID=2480810 RepID=A0A4Q8M9B9_9GAMM|nr:hypothetical protein [Pseudoxanthomonas winnipegensis]TAA45631.1 hypothetical protein EA655_05440 [Pseudoxanthomonas winnipegensis]
MSQHPSQSIIHDLAQEFEALDSRFLLALHHGDVDAVAIARRVLAERGIDGSGRWVGFAEAADRLGV